MHRMMDGLWSDFSSVSITISQHLGLETDLLLCLGPKMPGGPRSSNEWEATCALLLQHSVDSSCKRIGQLYLVRHVFGLLHCGNRTVRGGFDQERGKRLFLRPKTDYYALSRHSALLRALGTESSNANM